MKQIAPDGTADLINRERNEMRAARGIMLKRKTIRQWSLKFGQASAETPASGGTASRGRQGSWPGLLTTGSEN
jgi:hypothetical protein